MSSNTTELALTPAELMDSVDVVRKLGEGGMGTVHQVRHRAWQIDLAMKTPRRELLARSGALESFIHEAETWISLGLHPNIVTCFYVRTIDGVPRVFAELVPNGSVADAVRDETLYRDGPNAALARVLSVALDTAFGLGHAHTCGVIHQDIKPDNVLFAANGAKVADFGLARALRADAQVATAGMTPLYASPEQLERRELGKETDVWSWAATVVDMLLGGAHWMSSLALPIIVDDLVDEVTARGKVSPPPNELLQLLRECLEIEPKTRLSAFDEIAARVARICASTDGQPLRTAPKNIGTVADTLNNVGVSSFELGQVEAAKQALTKALELDSNHERASFNLNLVRWRNAETSDERLVRLLRERTETNPRADVARGLEASVALERADIVRFDELAARGLLGLPAEDAYLRRGRALLSRGNTRLTSWQIPSRRYSAVVASGDQAYVSGNNALDIFDLTNGTSTPLASPSATEDRYPKYAHVLLAGHGELLCALREDIVVKHDGVLQTHETKGTTLEIFDIAKRACIWQLSLSNHGPKCMTFVDAARTRVAVALYVYEADAPELVVVDLRDGKAHRIDVNAWPNVHNGFAGIDAMARAPAERSTLLLHTSLYFRVLDLESNTITKQWKHSELLSDLRVSNDGRRAIAGGRWATQWDIVNGVERQLSGVSGYVNNLGIKAVRFFSDDKRMIASDFANVVRVWDLERGRCLSTLPTNAEGSVALDTYDDGTKAVVLCHEAVQVYSLSTATPPNLAPSSIARPIEIAAVASRVENAEQLLEALEQAERRSDITTALGLLARARGEDDVARTTRAQNVARRLARRPNVSRGRLLDAWPSQTVNHGLGDVNVIALSSDGAHIAVGGMHRGRCIVLELASDARRELNMGHGEVYGLSFNANGYMLAGLTSDGTITSFHLPTSKQRFRYDAEQSLPSTVSSDATGDIVVASEAGGARIVTSNGLGFLKGHPGMVNAACVSRDGRLAATVGQDGSLSLYDVESLSLLRQIKLSEPANSIVLSDDASIVGCCGRLGTVRLFRVASGAAMSSLAGGASSGLGLWMSPDKTVMLSAADGGCFCVWDLSKGLLSKKVQTSGAFIYDTVATDDLHMVAIRGSEVSTWSLAWELIETSSPATALEPPSDRWDDAVRIGDALVFGDGLDASWQGQPAFAARIPATESVARDFCGLALAASRDGGESVWPIYTSGVRVDRSGGATAVVISAWRESVTLFELISAMRARSRKLPFDVACRLACTLARINIPWTPLVTDLTVTTDGVLRALPIPPLGYAEAGVLFRFFAPEELISKHGSTTPIYRAGVVLYEFAAGESPLKAGTDNIAALLRAVMLDERTPLQNYLPTLGEEAGALVARMIGRDSNVRTGDLLGALEKLACTEMECHRAVAELVRGLFVDDIAEQRASWQRRCSAALPNAKLWTLLPVPPSVDVRAALVRLQDHFGHTT